MRHEVVAEDGAHEAVPDEALAGAFVAHKHERDVLLIAHVHRRRLAILKLADRRKAFKIRAPLTCVLHGERTTRT